MVSEESGRRRFIRRLTTLGAAGGVAALMSGALPEKPLIPLAQAASGGALIINAVNDGESGITELHSTIVGVPGSGYAYGVFLGHDTATSGYAYGLMGVSDSIPGRGVRGWATAQSGICMGVHGLSDSVDGLGVYGWASALSGPTYGVYGQSDSIQGTGVEGYATTSESASGNAVGVYGHTDAPNTVGVRGIATASSSYMYSEAGAAGRYTAGVEGYASAGSGPVQGVYGHADSPDGAGVWGVATATSGGGCGIVGYSQGPDGAGVIGKSLATSGWATGVGGRSDAPGGSGVWGRAAATTGYGNGVYGQTDTPDGVGVWGYGSATSGYSTGTGGESPSPDGTGVWGHSTATTGYGTGVSGQTDAPDGTGVWGGATAATGGSSGVWGMSKSPDGVGVGGTARANGCVAVWGQAASGWPGAIPMVAHGTSGQTASLQEWERPDLGTLAVVDNAGQLGIGISTPVRQLHIRGNNAVARLDRNVDSASFIFVRTNTDYSQVLKTFTFGVKATGVDTGSFFIGDMHTNVSGSSDNRILIDTNGNVGLNTTSPTAKLDLNGSTGYNQLRMRTSYTPTGTSDSNGNTGDVAWNDSYVYVKTSAGWKRSALSTF